MALELTAQGPVAIRSGLSMNRDWAAWCGAATQLVVEAVEKVLRNAYQCKTMPPNGAVAHREAVACMEIRAF